MPAPRIMPIEPVPVAQLHCQTPMVTVLHHTASETPPQRLLQTEPVPASELPCRPPSVTASHYTFVATLPQHPFQLGQEARPGPRHRAAAASAPSLMPGRLLWTSGGPPRTAAAVHLQRAALSDRLEDAVLTRGAMGRALMPAVQTLTAWYMSTCQQVCLRGHYFYELVIFRQIASTASAVCARMTSCTCAAGVTEGSPLPSSVSPAAAHLRGHAGEEWLGHVFSEVVAADANGTVHGSGPPLTYAGAIQSSHSVTQPPKGDAVPPRDGFSFVTHGDDRAFGGVVDTLASSGDGTDLGAPARRSSLEAKEAVPAAAVVLREAGSGQPFAVGSHIADVLATSGTTGHGGAAEGGWVSATELSDQCLAGGRQRDDDDGNSAGEAASWVLQGQPTSSGGLSMLVSRSAGAGIGPGTEADAGLSSLLQPGLNTMTSPGSGLLDSILLGSPTRASPAAPPTALSLGYVHGIPRFSGGASKGGSPYPIGIQNAAGLATAATFGAAPSGEGSPYLTGNLSAAGLAAAASYGAAPHGLSAGSGVPSSAPAPLHQPATAGPARSPVAMGQAVPPGHMLPAGAPTTGAQVSSGDAAHVPARTAAASSIMAPVADGAAASLVAVAHGGRGAAAHAGSTDGGPAIGGLAASHSVAGTAANMSAQERSSSAADLYATSAAAGSVSSPMASSATGRHGAAAEGSQGAAVHGIGDDNGMATGGAAAPRGVAGPAAGTQPHSSVLAAPGALRRGTVAAVSEPSRMNSTLSADLPAEVHQQVLLCSRSLINNVQLLHACSPGNQFAPPEACASQAPGALGIAQHLKLKSWPMLTAHDASRRVCRTGSSRQAAACLDQAATSAARRRTAPRSSACCRPRRTRRRLEATAHSCTGTVRSRAICPT